MVDGIEREFDEAARVVRLSQHTPVGSAFADRLDLRFVPALVVYDGMGEVRLRFSGGLPNRQAVVDALKQE